MMQQITHSLTLRNNNRITNVIQCYRRHFKEHMEGMRLMKSPIPKKM